MRSDPARLQKVLDAATTFAMELEAPTHPGSTAFGTLDRATALAALARISGHRSEVLRDARLAVDAPREPVAAALLSLAAVWIVFAADD